MGGNIKKGLHYLIALVAEGTASHGMGALPAIVLLFTASVAWFDITEEKQIQIAKDLAERRKQND
jgi:hypothetical protein